MRESTLIPRMPATAERVVWRPTPRALSGVLANEFRKALLTFWAHRTPILGGIVAMGAFYLAIMIVIGRGELPRDLLPRTVVGMAAYVAVWLASLQMVADQLEEMRAGTLEQVHLSPAPPWLVVFGRVASTGLQAILVAAGVVVAVVLVADVELTLRWAALVPAGLTLLNVLAFSLLFAGIVLTFPFIGEIHHVAENLVGIFNGAFLPLALFPGWLQPIARLFPTTLGVEATQEVLVDGHSLAQLWSEGTLAWLLVYTVALAALALFVFVRNYGEALRDGGLGRY